MRSFFFAMLICLPLCAQDAPKQERKREPPKNLQVLKPEDIGPSMRAATQGLGVRCDFCHVQGDFASDDKPEKVTARMMFSMTRDINAKFSDGKAHVACYTCHRGEQMPKMSPPPASAPGQGR